MSKMLGIVGTVPDQAFPLTHGKAYLSGGRLRVDGREVSVNRGTPALLAAAIRAAEWLGGADIYAFLVGDIGRGEGSRVLYEFIEQRLPEFDLNVLAFHYLQPDVDWHNRVLFAVDAMAQRPVLIADAGFMYAAKMSGQAGRYDLFTPDRGELAFLADELAPHPFYTRGFILQQNQDVPDLIQRAYAHKNGAAYLMVKGEMDYLANEKQVIASVASPVCGAMEAIGGTGDTLTGLLTALCGAGYSRADAALLAARTNRLSGQYANPRPATQVAEIIDKIPQALSRAITDYQKEGFHGGCREN